MNSKFIRNILSTLVIVLLLGSSVSGVNAEEMVGLRKFNTNEKILLNGEPINIPNKVKDKDEEFRGVWVSTIYNLDFPSKKELNKEDYKKEYIKLLNEVEELNLNAIIFQVRPKGDAFYKSDINPWSENLTGKEGKSPGWDPLDWMIEETHNRGIEFHAWFNPYRVTASYDEKTSKIDQLKKLSDKNWAKKNPKNVFKYNGRLYLNPGSPEVIKHVNESIMEVVYKYDVDGVHLDDYFYPSKSIDKSETFYSEEEKSSYVKYGSNFSKIGDWRRSNVDNLVENINLSINGYNISNQDSVQFGISPFGIWRHKDDKQIPGLDRIGSNTPKSSQASYDNQFADTKKWVKEGWIDYIVPQIYWTFDEVAAPYAELVNWWANVVKDTKVDLYIGHAVYKKAGNDKVNSWSNPREISNQLKFNSLYDEIKGSVHFRYKNLLKSDHKVNNESLEILRKEHYNKKVKLPKKEGISGGELKKPYELRVESTILGNNLTWKDYKDNNSIYYLVYREEIIEDKLENIQVIDTIRRKNNENFINYSDKTADPYKKHKYSISSLNQLYQESELID